jgi:hypothetical protein
MTTVTGYGIGRSIAQVVYNERVVSISEAGHDRFSTARSRLAGRK